MNSSAKSLKKNKRIEDTLKICWKGKGLPLCQKNVCTLKDYSPLTEDIRRRRRSVTVPAVIVLKISFMISMTCIKWYPSFRLYLGRSLSACAVGLTLGPETQVQYHCQEEQPLVHLLPRDPIPLRRRSHHLNRRDGSQVGSLEPAKRTLQKVKKISTRRGNHRGCV